MVYVVSHVALLRQRYWLALTFRQPLKSQKEKISDKDSYEQAEKAKEGIMLEVRNPIAMHFARRRT